MECPAVIYVVGSLVYVFDPVRSLVKGDGVRRSAVLFTAFIVIELVRILSFPAVGKHAFALVCICDLRHTCTAYKFIGDQRGAQV